MSKLDKLMEVARNAPQNLTFDDLVRLLGWKGFLHKRTTGSHEIYENANGDILNVQPGPDGKAKKYQVKQFLKAICEKS